MIKRVNRKVGLIIDSLPLLYAIDMSIDQRGIAPSRRVGYALRSVLGKNIFKVLTRKWI